MYQGDRNGRAQPPQLIRNQKQITSAAVDVIQGISQKRGKPLQSRDRMALKLLTPKNSALIVKNGVRNLGCHQIAFDIMTEDFGKGSHRLTPNGVHINRPDGGGWWSDQYGGSQFLWNLYLKEDPTAGMIRILERLFRFKTKGIFGSTADIQMKRDRRTIVGDVNPKLKLYIKREEGSIETSLRRMIKAQAIYSPKDIGLPVDNNGKGQIVLLFGREKNYGISFLIEKL